MDYRHTEDFARRMEAAHLQARADCGAKPSTASGATSAGSSCVRLVPSAPPSPGWAIPAGLWRRGGSRPRKRKRPCLEDTGVREAGKPYLTSIWRAVTTGFFLPSESVSTPCSSLAEVASASIASGSS
jgi:hypothetical protein